MTQPEPAVLSREWLEATVEHLAHLLPAQGPIGVFIHHNTLHAFEHLPFDEAVRQAFEIYGAEPYLSEDKFRAHLASGRIVASDVDEVLDEEPDLMVVPYELSRRQLRRAMLLDADTPMTAAEVRWWLSEGTPSTTARQRFAKCLRSMRARPLPLSATHRDAAPVDALMIRLCSAYLDQGVSHWPMSDREDGFLQAVRLLLSESPIEAFPGLRAEFRRQLGQREPAGETAIRLLTARRTSEEQAEEVLRSELLVLRGWAGLFRRLEKEPELAPHEQLPCSLLDYLAVRLTLLHCAGEPETRMTSVEDAELEAAASLFSAVEALPPSFPLASLGRPNLDRLCEEVLAFDSIERRRLWQAAFERRHEKQILAPLVAKLRSGEHAVATARPSAQVITCIDEREESFRRHLEETDPEIETLGAAGFFGVAMNYAGIDDAGGVSLCPIVVKPKHAVREVPVPDDESLGERRRAIRRIFARAGQNSVRSTQSLWLGWISTTVLGIFSLFPLLARVLAPRHYGRLRDRLNELFMPVPRTEVTLMRTDAHSHDVMEGLQLGFTLAEKIDRVAGVLAPAGLKERFARIVFVMGHGSSSLNNPHESAYDCGACGGRKGGPNARLFALMANRASVREGLRDRGIAIPDDTWFLAACHDTANDTIDLFDLAELPSTHAGDLKRLRETLDKARAANALERCRRFETASSVDSPAHSLKHVESRTEHLAEPRPECGHGTNACAFVGRRSLTRGLFYDRRAFLVSYDAQHDPNGAYLEQLLAAGGPVCAGINLEYYFSTVDNTQYGCGTKLPHNITGLMGVMDGAASDLRTGLPLQMVEIHEAVRILFVIEARLDLISAVMRRLPAVERLVKNQWVRIAAVDPETQRVFVLRKDGFQPFEEMADLPVRRNSRDWYRGQMDHLPVARIGAAA